MKVKVFTKNQNNKIEFTEKELQKLLDEIYNEGYSEGYSNGAGRYFYTTPYYTKYPYTVTTATYSNNLRDVQNLEGEQTNEIN